jgi:hypothetical protein
VGARGIALVVIAIAIAPVLSACTSPSLFPAILAEPTPRDETPLSPEQVKQATADLISDRDRLCAEALADQGRHASPQTVAGCSSAYPVATGTTRPAGTTARP